jgi:putative NAD(P)-binding protein
VVRPGMLTDDPGTGRVRLSTELGGRWQVPRDDVAAVLAEVLEAPNTIGIIAELSPATFPLRRRSARYGVPAPARDTRHARRRHPPRRWILRQRQPPDWPDSRNNFPEPAIRCTLIGMCGR